MGIQPLMRLYTMHQVHHSIALLYQGRFIVVRGIIFRRWGIRGTKHRLQQGDGWPILVRILAVCANTGDRRCLGPVFMALNPIFVVSSTSLSHIARRCLLPVVISQSEATFSITYARQSNLRRRMPSFTAREIRGVNRLCRPTSSRIEAAVIAPSIYCP